MDRSAHDPTRGRGRPREFDADAALDAAMRLFWRRGYAATSLTELTAAMGIGRSSLYAGFGTKHDVLVQAIGRYVDSALAEVEAAAAAAPDPVSAVRAMLLRVAEPDGGDRGCFLVNCITELAPDDPDVVAAARRTTDRLEALLSDALVAAGASGARDPAHRRAAARALISVAHGATLMRKSGRSGRHVREMLASVDPLIRG